MIASSLLYIEVFGKKQPQSVRQGPWDKKKMENFKKRGKKCLTNVRWNGIISELPHEGNKSSRKEHENIKKPRKNLKKVLDKG